MTPTDLAGAVRLAQTVIDAERKGIRQTMTGGYVGTIAHAFIATVEERDAAIAASVARDTELHRECARLEHERDEAKEALAAITAAAPKATVLTEACRCGSGGHPRECKRHPLAYDQHVAEMNAETREVAAERTRTAEEIAAWCDAQAADLSGLSRASDYRMVASHIRQTFKKEQSE